MDMPEDPWVYWPVRLAYLVSSRPMRGLVSKKVDDTPLLGSSLYMHMHTGTYIFPHTCAALLYMNMCAHTYTNTHKERRVVRP